MIAAIYARYSSENQRDESIDAQVRAINDYAQVRAINDYAQRNGHNIIRTYADEAKSALTDQRPQFQQMIKDAEAGLFEAVIVHKLDRFSRDRYDSAMYKRKLKLSGVRLFSVLENLDNSPESIVLESVLEGMAEYYSKNLARETMKGLRENALQGKHTGGKPALGYDVDNNGKYVINPKEAEAVKIIFTMKAEGRGYSEILDHLNLWGYKTKRGNKFGKNSLHDLLKNGKYIGILTYNKAAAKYADKRRNNHAVKNEDEIIRIEDGCPAIIDKELWEKVHFAMEQEKRTRVASKAREPYLLTGLIFCGKCGGAMVGNHYKRGDNTYRYYECSSRKRTRNCDKKNINKAYIEEEVINALYNRLFAPEVIENITDTFFEASKEYTTSSKELIKSLDIQHRDVVIKINKMIDAIAEGLYNPSMKERMTEYENTITLLESQISEVEKQQQIGNLTREQIRDYLRQYENIKTMSSIKQRDVIRRFVKKVTIFDDHADIDVFMDGGKTYRARLLDSVGSLHGSPTTIKPRFLPRFYCCLSIINTFVLIVTVICGINPFTPIII